MVKRFVRVVFLYIMLILYKSPMITQFSEKPKYELEDL